MQNQSLPPASEPILQQDHIFTQEDPMVLSQEAIACDRVPAGYGSLIR